MKCCKFGIFCMFAFFVCLSSCKKDEDVIAKVGTEKITSESFSERLLSTPPSYQAYLNTEQGKKQFVDLMVREMLIMESAKQAGVNKRQEYKHFLYLKLA